MSPFDFALITLSTLYCGYTVSSTAGPFDVFATLRKRLPLGGLTACPKCLLPWVAVVMVVLWELNVFAVLWVLASAGAGLVLMFYVGMLYGNDVHD